MAEDGCDRDQQQQQPAAAAASGGAGVEGRSRESVKLFVGQVPKQMSEAELVAMFRGVALVDEVTVIRDRATRVSRGCCFLICPSREEADKAVTAYHNKRTLPGASSPLQVKYADGELERLEHKLFVGMLPKNVTDAEMIDLFSKYGNIKDLQILRGSQQTSKAGCAFLKYETKEQAVAAIEALNGTHKIEGSSVPLVVKWADTEKERQARKAQKSPFQSSNMLNANAMRQNSVFGALQMGYVPQYNGFGYQPQGTYGLMQYPPLSPVQNQAAFQNMVQPINQASSTRGANSELPPDLVPRSFNSTQLGSPYSPLPGLQYPGVYPGGPINHRPFSNSHSSTKVQNLNANLPSSSPSSNPAPQIEGPPGANLFIYHIPQEFGDHDLANAFHSFGRVLSAKVFVDKATGVSKCFGFVSYDSPASAQAAISVMNGYQLGGKKLKVQLKRDNSKHSKPF
ncbi:RNA-binding protein BRN1 [Zea mays]|uniref:RNA-binding protein BRN1 n=2 Tax=Zea mays TaxID=4577 RepID=A0A1D6FMK3_MAIZE|nr:RNA-binding protein BRN1 [Zea mays]AQK92892.1 RNA-binding protein BRN1 [Zea mays]AQK92894.1 RNA-binding protein BRN1 [Zea mays]|eukprot:XP_008656158.1 RNA-binding protein BRN1 [Zea mays]